jgi:tryptophan-rich sensory protein
MTTFRSRRRSFLRIVVRLKPGESNRVLFKRPSAVIPIALSLGALAAMLMSFAIFGVPHREADEGTAAHLFQIWLVLEVIGVAFFAIKYLPQEPRQAILILVLQVVAVIAACAPVFMLNL